MTQQLARTDDGYQDAQRIARDAVCGRCGAQLVVKWTGGDAYQAMCLHPECAGSGVRLRSDVAKDELRQRAERSPGLVQSLVTTREMPLTTQAIRDLDSAMLLKRVPDRYGDAIAVTPAQKIQIAQLARIYGLDPLWDLMIYEGRPYVTYDGRLRKLREHPEYRGHKVRPMTRSEKEEWGYEPADLVIQCDVDMGPRGIVTDWGIVRAEEVKTAQDRARTTGKRAAPVGVHPQQIGIKRAVSRASKQAVGIDLPTVMESSGRVIDVQEVRPARTPSGIDPETQARRRFWSIARGSPPDGLGLSDEDVHRLLGVSTLKDYPGGWDQALSDLTERAAADQAAAEAIDVEPDYEDAWETEPEPPAEVEVHQTVVAAAAPSRDMVGVRSAVSQRHADLVEEAARLDIDIAPHRISYPAPKEDVLRSNERLEDEIDRVKRRLAGERTDDAPAVEQDAF